MWSSEAEDPAEALERVLSSRCQTRMREAMLWYLEGVSAREAASRSGLRDHRNVVRQAHRLGISHLHERRRRYRQALHRTQRLIERPWAQKILSGERASLRQLLAAQRQSVDMLDLERFEG